GTPRSPTRTGLDTANTRTDALWRAVTANTRPSRSGGAYIRRSRHDRDGTVKPSAQPTQVRTLHLPPAVSAAQRPYGASSAFQGYAARCSPERPFVGGHGIYAGWIRGRFPRSRPMIRVCAG